ncbi:cystatin-S-like [Chionomys nivalis]|uniref:cystatin-S-like n=1 Tax=Chionomys nivalis TaxID=269649 RepID=UPI0025997F9A|nr:cystatin-S-like [Chionomys nivalis]
MTTLMVALNLSLSPMLVHTLQNDTELFSVQKIGAPEALQYAVSKYNENSDDLYQYIVVEMKDTKFQHEEDGTKYLFHVILGESTCLKSKTFFASCPLNYPLQVSSRLSVYPAPYSSLLSHVSNDEERALHTAAEAPEADDAESMLEDPDVELLSGTDCEDLEDFK